jgi:hypothetical protein
LVKSDVGTVFLKHVTEGKIEGAGRQRIRRKQLPNDLEETKSYWKLKEEVLDRTLWRTQFERGCGPFVRLRNDKTGRGSNIGLECRDFSCVFLCVKVMDFFPSAIYCQLQQNLTSLVPAGSLYRSAVPLTQPPTKFVFLNLTFVCSSEFP